MLVWYSADLWINNTYYSRRLLSYTVSENGENTTKVLQIN